MFGGAAESIPVEKVADPRQFVQKAADSEKPKADAPSNGKTAELKPNGSKYPEHGEIPFLCA